MGVLLLAASATACGGGAEHAPPMPADRAEAGLAPAPDVSRGTIPAPSPGHAQTTSITQTAGNPEQGLLDLHAIGSVEQSLGSLSFEVRDRGGAVLSHGFNEVQGPDAERHLLLQLSAGADYQLSLDSTSPDAPALKCHAAIGPLSILADATASYQAFIWQCDDGPITPVAADGCYWLTDFVGVSRSRAAVGETIELSVSGFDSTGTPARVTWSEPGAAYGSISERHAAQTTFRCEAASDAIALSAVVSGDGCSRRVQVTVGCY